MDWLTRPVRFRYVFGAVFALNSLIGVPNLMYKLSIERDIQMKRVATLRADQEEAERLAAEARRREASQDLGRWSSGSADDPDSVAAIDAASTLDPAPSEETSPVHVADASSTGLDAETLHALQDAATVNVPESIVSLIQQSCLASHRKSGLTACVERAHHDYRAMMRLREHPEFDAVASICSKESEQLFPAADCLSVRLSNSTY